MIYKFLRLKSLILFIIYKFFYVITKITWHFSKKIIKDTFIKYFELKVDKHQSRLLDQNLKNKHKFDDLIITGKHHTWNRFKFSTILISTKSDIDRLESTRKHLENLDIKHFIHDAVIYKTLKNVLLEGTNIVSDSKVSQICCFVSHIFAIDQILKSSSDDIFLILEDDVRLFPDPYLIGLENIINNKDWEIVTFEHHMPYTFFSLKEAFNHGKLLQRWDNPKDYGASAYFITRDFATKIVNYFLKDTSEGRKIDLEKTYIYHREIVPDHLVFDLGNTLISTFPLSLQNPDFSSQIGYKKSHYMQKMSAIDEVVKLWKSYYKYN